jgi:uncharacterized protein (TIGR00251 family)
MALTGGKAAAGKTAVRSAKTRRLKVQVRPRSRKQRMQKTADGEYKVHVLSPPSEGKANKEAIAVIASYFDLPPSRVKIAKGLKSRQKIVVLEY